MQTQSNIHFYVNWAKERLDEMEAVLTSLESKVGEVQADARDKANKALADLRKSRDIFRDTVKKQEATFKLQSAAQLKAWREAADKLGSDTKQFATERQTDIDAAVKRMKADAAAAEEK